MSEEADVGAGSPYESNQGSHASSLIHKFKAKSKVKILERVINSMS